MSKQTHCRHSAQKIQQRNPSERQQQYQLSPQETEEYQTQLQKETSPNNQQMNQTSIKTRNKRNRSSNRSKQNVRHWHEAINNKYTKGYVTTTAKSKEQNMEQTSCQRNF
jgi:hypothetical protein